MQESERQYFEAMEALFAMPGWKLLKDDIAGWQAAIESKWRTIAPENIRYEQGRYEGLEQVVKHFELCETLKAHAEGTPSDPLEPPEMYL